MRVKKVDVSHADVRATILKMHAECFPGLEFNSLHGDWWIAYDGNVPVGFAGLWASLRVPGAGYLCRSGVLPKARGKGLQRRFVRVREREARKKGWIALLSDTDPKNAHSTNNLIACGFRAFRPEPAHLKKWCGDNWCYWRKIIDDGVV